MDMPWTFGGAGSAACRKSDIDMLADSGSGRLPVFSPLVCAALIADEPGSLIKFGSVNSLCSL
jgi:hypothetical protein